MSPEDRKRLKLFMAEPVAVRVMKRERKLSPEWQAARDMLCERPSLFHGLSSRREAVIKESLGIGVARRSLAEIAKSHGVTRGRVRQILIIAMRKISNKVAYESRKGLASDPIGCLGLSSRAHNALLNGRIWTAGEIVALTNKELLHVKNLGKKSLIELRKATDGVVLTDVERRDIRAIVVGGL
jgi:hypothetical protein